MPIILDQRRIGRCREQKDWQAISNWIQRKEILTLFSSFLVALLSYRLHDLGIKANYITASSSRSWGLQHRKKCGEKVTELQSVPPCVSWKSWHRKKVLLVHLWKLWTVKNDEAFFKNDKNVIVSDRGGGEQTFSMTKFLVSLIECCLVQKKVEDRQQLKLLSWQEVHISYFQGLLITSYEDERNAKYFWWRALFLCLKHSICQV